MELVSYEVPHSELRGKIPHFMLLIPTFLFRYVDTVEISILATCSVHLNLINLITLINNTRRNPG